MAPCPGRRTRRSGRRSVITRRARCSSVRGTASDQRHQRKGRITVLGRAEASAERSPLASRLRATSSLKVLQEVEMRKLTAAAAIVLVTLSVVSIGAQKDPQLDV